MQGIRIQIVEIMRIIKIPGLEGRVRTSVAALKVAKGPVVESVMAMAPMMVGMGLGSGGCHAILSFLMRRFHLLLGSVSLYITLVLS